MKLKLNRNLKTSLWVVLGMGLLYLVGYLLIGQSFVPSQFTEARNKSGLIAKEIVTLTEESLKNLDVISLNDREYNFRKALGLVREELERAKNSRIKAVELTKQLDAMARGAAGITPLKARNLATQAIADELSLISHMIVYNDALNGLLQTLEFKFSGDIRYDSQEVQNLIKNMNNEAKEINNLNESFNQKMQQLDKMVGQ